MTLLTLRTSTGNDHADAILSGVVSLWEGVFPQRICGYYLSGSYANATATSTSDLDITILFKQRYRGEEEINLAQQMCDSIEALHPTIFVDIGYLSEESLGQADRVSVALQLKLSSCLIYGEDIREKITATPDARYMRDAMHIPYFGSCYGRPQLHVLPFPLNYPDPNGRFYGYDGWRIPGIGGTEQAGTKILVVIVGRIATAIIALRTGHYVGTKRDSAQLYRAYVDDEWTDLVEQVYYLCKERWQYRIPTKHADQQQLRALCHCALAFENHFFVLYRTFLLKELQDDQQENQRRAVERLGQIIYPGADIDAALAALMKHADAELRNAVTQTQQQRARA